MNATPTEEDSLHDSSEDPWTDLYRHVSIMTSKLEMITLAMEARGGEYTDDMMFLLEDCIFELTHNMTEIRNKMDHPHLITMLSSS